MEGGYSVLRADPQGLATISDGYGRTIESASSDSALVLALGSIPAAPTTTFHRSTGDVLLG